MPQSLDLLATPQLDDRLIPQNVARPQILDKNAEHTEALCLYVHSRSQNNNDEPQHFHTFKLTVFNEDGACSIYAGLLCYWLQFGKQFIAMKKGNIQILIQSLKIIIALASRHSKFTYLKGMGCEVKKDE